MEVRVVVPTIFETVADTVPACITSNVSTGVSASFSKTRLQLLLLCEVFAFTLILTAAFCASYLTHEKRLSFFMENFVAGLILIVCDKYTLLGKYTLWVSNLCADTITEPVTTNATITNNLIRP